MKRVILLTLFFILTPSLLLFSLLLLSFTYKQSSNPLISLNQTPKVVFAALPASSHEMLIEANTTDARVTMIEDFFSIYKSDLLPFAAQIVADADKYGIDYRLIPAIAMKESSLCKRIPKDSHNCWGFGIYHNKMTKFDNYSDAIDTVTKTLATKYKAVGLETPEEIMSKYNPVSINGAWAVGVSSYMDRLTIDL